MFIAKQMIDDSIQSAKHSITSTGSQQKKIDWDDFNYPPFLNVIHYNIEDPEQDRRLIVRALWLAHVLIFLESILNIINNIIIVATVSGQSGVRIFYSFLFFISFNPIITGYKGLCGETFLLKLYKWTQIVVIICWILFSIVKFLGFNGFIQASYLMKNKYVFQGILSIIESCLFLISALLGTFSVIKVYQLKEE